MPVQFFLRCGLPLVTLGLLCSCASLKKASPVAMVGIPEEKISRPTVTRAVSLGPLDGTTKPTSRTEEITQRVRAGTLIETGRGSLVFCLSRPPRNSPGGLFEDAIVLSRLRGQLKKVAGLPESVPGTATVQSARAYLKVTEQVSPEIAARAIDSALKTDGVAVVHVTTTPESRL